jgi:nitroreductase
MGWNKEVLIAHQLLRNSESSEIWHGAGKVAFPTRNVLAQTQANTHSTGTVTGLDSCPQEAWSSLGETIRNQLAIPANHVLFCGIAIGYADATAPVNNAIISRAPLNEMIRFEGI